MVDVREERIENTEAHGNVRGTGVNQCCWFNKELHAQILEEAKSRGWPFSRMVRFLCAASIGGIE